LISLAGKKFPANFFLQKVLSFMIELLTYYVIVAVVFVGAPGVFFFIVFMPALQNTKGRMVGYKDHKTYGDSSIYENTPSDTTKFFLQISGDHS
jgi:hypothetical protein